MVVTDGRFRNHKAPQSVIRRPTATKKNNLVDVQCSGIYRRDIIIQLFRSSGQFTNMLATIVISVRTKDKSERLDCSQLYSTAAFSCDELFEKSTSALTIVYS